MRTIVYLLFSFIWFQQGYCFAKGFFSSEDQETPSNVDSSTDLDELYAKLDNIFDGVTHIRSSLPQGFISDSGWDSSNEYFLKLSAMSKEIFHGKFIVGSLQTIHQIESIILSFHDQNDNILQDDTGHLLQYQATPLDLGHSFDVLPQNFDYAYARILLKLLSNSNFDPNSCFFHFSKSPFEKSSSTRRPDLNSDSSSDEDHLQAETEDATEFSPLIFSSTISIEENSNEIEETTDESETTTVSSGRIIDCPESLKVFEARNFTSSSVCPDEQTCFWTLHESKIFIQAPNPFRFFFLPCLIGERTLSYVLVTDDSYQNLSSCTINVKPDHKSVIPLYPVVNTIQGLWNTSAGGNSTFSEPSSTHYATTPGKYAENGPPSNAFDRNQYTKYTSFGSCYWGTNSFNMACGINTGFHLTLQSPSLLIYFRFRTARYDLRRVPLHITIEGSNANSESLKFGSSWTLIYNGSTGLNAVRHPYQFGFTMTLSTNIRWFESYRVLVLGKRDISSSVQYSEVELFGYYNDTIPDGLKMSR